MVRNSLPRLVVTSAMALAVLAGLAVPTASAAVENRILAPVASTGYVAIPNSVHPKAKLGTDLGATPGDTKLEMSIRFTRTEAQEAALDQLLADQQNPSSPLYHQWLTPAQFGAQFGMSSADLAKVSAWLTSQGFTVTAVANGGSFIRFTGTVAQAQTAFATSIHNLSVHGETHYANITNISVPGALAGVVGAVTGLHNFRLQPRIRTSAVKPDFTSSISGSHFIAPGDIYTVYNSSPLLNASTPINGTGETIAVVGQVDIYPADVAAFRSASGLSTTNLPTTIHAGTDPGYPVCNSCSTGPNEGDLSESSLDVEWSGAMAPNATIDFVTGQDVIGNSMTYAIDNDLAPIVTTSYGLCEAGWGYTELNSLNALFKQANAQGQTVMAAAADEGATDCDAGPSAEEGLSVDFPGSSPYVTSVGGTQFNEGTATGATSYWSGTNGTTGGSAISYIPEAVWNDEPAFDAYGGGGGGSSAFFTKPAWQVGTPADASRDVPDLSLDGSDAHDPLLFCVNVALGDSCTNGYRISNNDLEVAGGTSFDSQIFGGLLALIEQKLGSKGLGNINPTLYALGNSKYYVAGSNTLSNANVVFNDVTTGTNAMPCTVGTPDCPNGGQIGYSAGQGYDLATGWGSPNVANLATDWNLVTALGVGSLGANVSATNLSATPTSATTGTTVTLTATVTGASGTPTGSVQFFANNTSLGTVPLTTLNSTTATATYSWVTSCSYSGQQVMSASYTGDTNYQGSKGPALTANGGSETSNGSTQVTPVEVTVTGSTCADFSLTPTASSGVTVSGSTAQVVVSAGGTIPAVTISAAPTNGFTGTVTFSATATNTSGYAPTLTFSPASVTLSGTAAATTTLTFSGITAGLSLPNAPGQFDSGVMLATHKASRHPWLATGSGVTIASLMLLVIPRRRRLGGLLALLLAVALIGGASGCSSSQGTVSSNSGSTQSNPYIGTYVVTVIGSYTAANNETTQHVTQITYIIN